jgi:hypothetical protein
MKMNIADKKNHLTQKQIWLLQMLFRELGNKNLNEALLEWEKQNALQRSTKDTSTNNREQLISRLTVARENTDLKVIPAEPAATERAPEPLPSRTKRKSRSNE